MKDNLIDEEALCRAHEQQVSMDHRLSTLEENMDTIITRFVKVPPSHYTRSHYTA